MSRPRPVAFSFCLLAAALTLAWLALPRGGQASSTTAPPATAQGSPARDEAAEAGAGEAYGKLPISFVANEGQADERVKFISRGGGYSLSLTPTEAVLVLAGGREAVSAGLLLSDEYQGRARLVYGLYKIALGREPLYREFVREMRAAAEAGQPRLYAERWLKGRGLAAARSAKTDRDTVNSLRANAGLGAGDAARLVGEPTLNGKTRAELLTSVIGREEVREKLRAESRVLIHYFAFLRRDPEDEGRRLWAAAAGDALNLVSGFINSSEYRRRFGQ